MANRDNEHEVLTSYLQGGTPLSTMYQHSQSDGPNELTDARILAAAKAALDKKSRGAPLGGYQRMIPASIAALFILTFAAIFVADHYQAPPQPAPVLSGTSQSIRDTQKIAPLGETASKKPVTPYEESPAAAPMELARVESKTRSKPAPAAATDARVSVQPAWPTSISNSGNVAEQTQDKADALTPAKARAKNELTQQYATEGVTANVAGKQAVLAKEKTTAAIRPVDVWLKDITSLLKHQRNTQAREELQAFRKQNPEFLIDPQRYPEVAQLLLELEPHKPAP